MFRTKYVVPIALALGLGEGRFYRSCAWSAKQSRIRGEVDVLELLRLSRDGLVDKRTLPAPFRN